MADDTYIERFCGWRVNHDGHHSELLNGELVWCSGWTANRKCEHPGCEETPPTSYWGIIKSDWFYLKDGRAWCPKHIPDSIEVGRLPKRD